MRRSSTSRPAATAGDGGLVVAIDADDSITFAGLAPGQLTAADFALM